MKLNHIVKQCAAIVAPGWLARRELIARWALAQQGESAFWQGIANNGYDSREPEEFVKTGQKKHMLYHVYDPEQVVAEISRIAKPGAHLLFQVFVYLDQEHLQQKTGHHADLHPHSFTEETALKLIRSKGFEIYHHDCGKDCNPEGEHYFIALGRKSVDLLA